jgi:hypothetical protein
MISTNAAHQLKITCHSKQCSTIDADTIDKFLCVVAEARRIGGSGIPGQRQRFIAVSGCRLPSIRSAPSTVKKFCAQLAAVRPIVSIHCVADSLFAPFPGVKYSLLDVLMKMGGMELLYAMIVLLSKSCR